MERVHAGVEQQQAAGSDGNLKRGLTRIFNDLGNGVVKDVRTGLMWEKKSDDGGIHDKDNRYSWGQGLAPLPSVMNGTMVTTFLAALNTAPCFAGFCDWRIPNRRELESIANLEREPATFPAFDTNCAPGCTVTSCSCTDSNFYWSSSTYWVGSFNAWYVSFYDSGSAYGGKVNELHVRAVRGGF